MLHYDVIVPFRPDGLERSEIWEWVRRRWELCCPGANLIVADAGGQDFSRSASRNKAFNQSTSDMLVIADADVIPIRSYIDSALQLSSLQSRPFLAYDVDQYYNLSWWYSRGILNDNPDAEISRPEDPAVWEFRVTSWAGMLVMPRECFIDIGGYDENFHGWGYEDSAFAMVVKAYYGGFGRIGNAWLGHLWHPYTKESTWENPSAVESKRRFHGYRAGSLSRRAMEGFLSFKEKE